MYARAATGAFSNVKLFFLCKIAQRVEKSIIFAVPEGVLPRLG